MYGLVIAFKNFKVTRGIEKSAWMTPWYYWFEQFFTGPNFWPLLRNTFFISGLTILFGFPAPIILALLLNEVRNNKFKRTVQTITYMPYFISMVVMAGIVIDFVATDGVITNALHSIGLVEQKNLLSVASYFRPIYIATSMWQGLGYGSIIYLAALSGVDQELYEAARIDGCGFFRTYWKIVFPLLKPTVATVAIIDAMAFWNDYLLPSLVLTGKENYTIPIATQAFYGTYSTDIGLVMAALLLAMLPILILYFFLQKYIVAGVTAGAVKG